MVIGLTQSSYSFSENEEQPQICASITSGQLQRELVLTVIPTPSSASAVSDFDPDTQVLVFSELIHMSCVNVGIVDDGFLEDNEVFSVALGNNGNGPIVQLGTITVANVVIQDNDGKMVSMKSDISAEIKYESSVARSSRNRFLYSVLVNDLCSDII